MSNDVSKAMQRLHLSDKQFDDMCKLVNEASGLVKTVVGIGNNAAWAACLDAMYQIRKHPRYRQSVKGGTTPKREFKHCFDMFKRYERQLLFSDRNRYFHVEDMAPETRKAYGPNLTDRQYYDFWCAFGFTAYQQTKPFFTSLVNKIRLGYLHHGDPNADIMGWAVGAQCALDIASSIWQSAISSCDNLQRNYVGLNIPQKQWAMVFGDFNLRQIADRWEKCVEDLNPDCDFVPSEVDQKNISAGYNQLAQLWLDEDTLYGSRIKTAEDYAEIFRTNGEMKKAMAAFAAMRDKIAAAN